MAGGMFYCMYSVSGGHVTQGLTRADLQLARVRVTGVGQEAEVAGVTGEGDQSRGVGWGAGDDVDHLHVADVVDVQALLQANNKSL